MANNLHNYVAHTSLSTGCKKLGLKPTIKHEYRR